MKMDLLEEKVELDEKIVRLREFLQSPNARSSREIEVLTRQLRYMGGYSLALSDLMALRGTCEQVYDGLTWPPAKCPDCAYAMAARDETVKRLVGEKLDMQRRLDMRGLV